MPWYVLVGRFEEPENCSRFQVEEMKSHQEGLECFSVKVGGTCMLWVESLQRG